MFARFYLIVGALAMLGFGYAQYRGVSPFDTYANTTSGGTGGRLGSSHTYHK